MNTEGMSSIFTSMEEASDDFFISYEKSMSAPTTPTETSVMLAHGVSHKRRGKGHRVNFPEDDRIVTGYVEPPNPWGNTSMLTSDDLLEAYRKSCVKQGVKPIPCVVSQVKSMSLYNDRTQDLNLKGETLNAKHCEAMEDIFKAVQFNNISLESCNLDDEGAATVFDMIEYYESAKRLNISHNKSIDSRGWQACSRMLKRTSCLQHLDARSTALSEQTLLILGRALRLGSHLHSLHLENCSLTGRSLVILVAALKLNPALKELYLGENGMCSADGLQLANLLRANSHLEYLDLRGNRLQDVGVSHLADGLARQPEGSGDGLQTLVLWNNHITPAGMRHVARALIGTRSLITLNLGHNHVGNEGVHTLKDALLRNKTLHNLGLQCTKITCEGAVALAEVIADSQNLTRLDLRENAIRMGGVMALAQSLRLSKHITRLDLDPVKASLDSEEDAASYAKLFHEILDHCRKNRRPSQAETPTSTFFNGQPPEAPKTTVAETVTTSSSAPTTQRPPLNSSLSINTVINGNPIPPPSPNSRFRVSRVCLETDAEHSSESSGRHNEEKLERSHSAPASVPSRFTVTPVNGFSAVDEEKKEGKDDQDFMGHEVSEPVPIPHQRYEGSAEDADNFDKEEEEEEEEMASDSPSFGRTSPPWFMYPATAHQKKNGEERKRKISFFLPEGEEVRSSVTGMRNDRRMSTPAMPVTRYASKKKLTLKLCKRLESLDLRSSVPLSPTRLLESWAFPEPAVDFKFPSE
ncbi:protein phosphatase 1 regulatory subunit 37-like isoform X2 [Ornithodoros turicata]|uniref:protein phosphatase 1 regulatory subunit 37-like isoform X2 n=1 Tax=Ornithodoros turicata TaxID=34597 RepID=UPI0031388348